MLLGMPPTAGCFPISSKKDSSLGPVPHRIAFFASPFAGHAVDVTATIDRGVASLRAHAAYLAGLGDGSVDPDAFLRDWSKQAGERFGGRLAATFELIEW